MDLKTILKSRQVMITSIACIVVLLLAIALFHSNSGKKVPDLEEQLALGQKYLEEMDYDNAILAFGAAIDIDPKCEEAYVGLANAYVGLEDYDKAVEVLNDGLQKVDEPISLHEKLLDIYLETENYEKCIEELKELIKLDDDNEDYYRQLIDIYEKEGMTEELIEFLNEIKDSEILQPEIYTILAEIYQEENMPDEIIDLLEPLQDEDFFDKELSKILAEAYQDKDMGDQAIGVLEKIIDKGEADGEIYYILAELYKKKGENDKAEEAALQSIKEYNSETDVDMKKNGIRNAQILLEEIRESRGEIEPDPGTAGGSYGSGSSNSGSGNNSVVSAGKQNTGINGTSGKQNETDKKTEESKSETIPADESNEQEETKNEQEQTGDSEESGKTCVVNGSYRINVSSNPTGVGEEELMDLWKRQIGTEIADQLIEQSDQGTAVYKDGETVYVAFFNTESYGQTYSYSVEVKNITSNVDMVFTAPGCTNVRYSDLALADQENVQMQEVKLLYDDSSLMETQILDQAEIRFTSAVDNSPVEGLTVSLLDGWNNKTQDYVAQTTTDGDGCAIFRNISSGYYTVEYSGEGYIKGYENCYIPDEITISVSPKLEENQYRVVLKWGESPNDLDLHCVGKAGDSSFHVYYSNKQYEYGDNKVELDVDDTTAYGPETITFTVTQDSSFAFYVYNFSGNSETELSMSGATVTFYRGDSDVPAKEYRVPTDKAGLYWNIFSIDDGVVNEINEVSDTPVSVE